MLATRSVLPCCVGERTLIVGVYSFCHQLTARQRIPPPLNPSLDGGRRDEIVMFIIRFHLKASADNCFSLSSPRGRVPCGGCDGEVERGSLCSKPVIMVCSFFFHHHLSYRVTPRPASFARRPLVTVGEEKDASQPPGWAKSGGNELLHTAGNTRRRQVSDSPVTQLQLSHRTPGQCKTVTEPRCKVGMYTWYSWIEQA